MKVKAEINDLLARRQQLIIGAANNGSNGATPQQDVEKALSQLKNMQRSASTPEARIEIRAMLDELGCRIGLGFVDAIKRKKRPVR